jgi:hypothetical protein
MPIPQARVTNGPRLTTGALLRITSLIRAADESSGVVGVEVASDAAMATALPNAERTGCSVSDVSNRLNLVRSFQMKFGSDVSRSDDGDSPRFRASENRNSASADGDPIVWEDHHSGHAASITS